MTNQFEAFGFSGAYPRGFGFATVLLVSLILACPAKSQELAPVDTATAIHIVEIGFEGKFKVGAWTPIRVVIDPRVVGASRVRLEIQTVDGDGVRATHADAEAFDIASLPSDDAGLVSCWRNIRIGRLRANIVVRVVDEGGLVLATQTQGVDPAHGSLPSTHGLVLGLGPEIGFRQWLGDRQKRIDERAFEYVHIGASDRLPQDPASLETVDLMVLTIGDGSLFAEDSGYPWETIAQWVMGGGVLIVNGAEGAESLADGDHPIARLLPGQVTRAVRVSSSAGAETFVSANDQLLARGETYSVMPLQNPRGRILAYERVDSTSVPLVVDTTQGMGRVVWMGADLSAVPLDEWNSRPRLLGRLVETLRDNSFGVEPQRVGRVAHLGYDDLAGQLRSALDRYQRVSLVTFTGVALAVVAFILVIGPLDYWFVTRLLKRPEWTWATSAIVIIALTVAAAFGFRLTKGDTILANQLEVVDVDAETGQMRGSVWVHLYSPEVRRFDLHLARRDEFQTDGGHSSLAWEGLSGSGLGGMDQEGTAATSQGGYRIEQSARETWLRGIAVQVASTRALSGRWRDRFEAPIRHRLYLDRRNNSLHGDFTNPFPFTLDRAVVFYDNWAYIINEDVQPGETISIEGQSTERTLEALLARRTFVQGTERAEPWDPTSSNLDRIAEILSFHESVGGRNYTKLNHQLHADIDWSAQLRLGNAVLYARCSEPVTRLVDGDAALDEEYDERLSIIRVILPVNTDRPAVN